jgi:hypothetical protein
MKLCAIRDKINTNMSATGPHQNKFFQKMADTRQTVKRHDSNDQAAGPEPL